MANGKNGFSWLLLIPIFFLGDDSVRSGRFTESTQPRVSPGAIGSEFLVLIEVPIVLLSLGLWNLEAVLLPTCLGCFTAVSLALCQKCVTGIFSSFVHIIAQKESQNLQSNRIIFDTIREFDTNSIQN